MTRQLAKSQWVFAVNTPCRATSAFWKNASTLGTEGGSAISASHARGLRDNDYFEVCINGSGPTEEFLQPMSEQFQQNVERWQGPIDNHDVMYLTAPMHDS